MASKPWLFSLGALLVSAGLAAAQPGAGPDSPYHLVGQRTGLALPTPEATPSTTPILPPNCVNPCGEDPRLTVQGEYLLWWLKPAPTPTLLTTSANPNDLGVLGAPTTTTLFGGGDMQFGPASGVRLFADYRLNDTWGIAVGGFLMEQQARGQAFRSDPAGTPTIGIPFLSVFDGSEQANLLASPGALAGSAAVRLDNRLWGVEANATAHACDNGEWHLNVLGGFRYAYLRERLRLDTTSTLLATPGLFAGSVVGPGTTFIGFDDFSTSNAFYGGQLGFDAAWQRGAFFISTFTKVALGVTQQRSSIRGGTTALLPNGTSSTAIGETLALSTNVGRITNDRFGVLPEVGVNAGVQLTNHLTLFGGYQFLQWNDVARPGDQINRNVNSNLIPTQDDGTRLGPQLPSAALHHTDFWAHGLNFGVQFVW
jgi:hypothetical protein